MLRAGSVLDNLKCRFYRGCTVFRPRRLDASRLALEALVPHARTYRRSLADEVAIDFPSSRAAIEFFRRDLVETVWSEPCDPCDGHGQALQTQRLMVNVPAGVAHGHRFGFNLWLPRGPRTRVDVRVAVVPIR